MSVLSIEHINAGYGDFQALFDISLDIVKGELLALVGANGAGKSTLMRSIAGEIRPMNGRVMFDGQDVTTLPATQRSRLGIGLVPEGRRLFPSLTVEENLLVGTATKRSGPWDLAAVYELLPLVQDRRKRRAAGLSGGEQQAVAIGRALMGNPTLLLLDEVSLGLAPIVIEQLYDALPRIRAEGMTMLLVEQDLTRTLKVAEDIACILEGRVVLQGAAGSFTREQVTNAYFGTGYGSTEEVTA